MLAIELDELAAESEASQVLLEKPALAPTAQAQFAHQLLVSGLASCRGGDARHEFAIGHMPRLEPDLPFRVRRRWDSLIETSLRG
jgi:hypothetical protein